VDEDDWLQPCGIGAVDLLLFSVGQRWCHGMLRPFCLGGLAGVCAQSALGRARAAHLTTVHHEQISLDMPPRSTATTAPSSPLHDSAEV
jgi:hypothetical protein